MNQLKHFHRQLGWTWPASGAIWIRSASGDHEVASRRHRLHPSHPLTLSPRIRRVAGAILLVLQQDHARSAEGAVEVSPSAAPAPMFTWCWFPTISFLGRLKFCLSFLSFAFGMRPISDPYRLCYLLWFMTNWPASSDPRFVSFLINYGFAASPFHSLWHLQPEIFKS